MVYEGDPGHCPMCHNTTMVLSEQTDQVTCAVCGMVGSISVEDGKIHVRYDPAEFEKSHVTDSGKYLHLLDMNMRGRIEMIRPMQHKEELQAIVKAGTSRYTPLKPSRKDGNVPK